MRTGAIAVILAGLATAAAAHGLDEYVQAVLVGVEKDHVTLSLRLVPGVEVLPAVLRGMDADKDGEVSPAERQAYPARVRGDLELTLNGKSLPLRLVSSDVPPDSELKDGVGRIRMEFRADFPPGTGAQRLILKNRHQSGIGAYLVNSIASKDPDIRLGAQRRNADQSIYRLDYVRGDAQSKAR